MRTQHMNIFMNVRFGLATIREGTTSLNSNHERDEEDPFAECDAEFEEDEMLIDDENLCTTCFLSNFLMSNSNVLDVLLVKTSHTQLAIL